MFPASYLQERFFHSLRSHVSGEIVAMVWRLTGRLDRLALQIALDGLVRRHEALRTTLTQDAGQLMQRIQPSPCIDGLTVATPLAHGNRDQVSTSLLASGICEPVDLTRGPTVRARLLEIDRLEHVLSIAVHHAFCDGWSTQLISRDLWALYDATIADEPALIPTRVLQMADYAVWERSAAQHDREAYWRRALAQAQTTIPFQRRAPTSAGPRRRPSLTKFEPLSPTATSRLFRCARAEQASPGMALAAVSLAALSTFGAAQGLFAIVDANRSRREFRDTVGCLYDMRPLPVRLSDAMSLRELLHHVRDAWRDAYAHQLPLVALTRLQEQATAVRPIDFDAAMNLFTPLTSGKLELSAAGGLHVRLEASPSDWGRADADFSYSHEEVTFDLTLDGDGGLDVGVESNAALHLPADIATLANRFSVIAERAPLQPSSMVARLVASP